MGLRSRRSQEFLPTYKGTRRTRSREVKQSILPVDMNEDSDVKVRKVKHVDVTQEDNEPLYATVTTKPTPVKAPEPEPAPAQPKKVKPPRAKRQIKISLPGQLKLPRFGRRTTIVIVAVLAILLGIGTYFFLSRNAKPSNDAVISQVEKLSGITGVNPAVLDIIDSSKVDQPFLKGTQDGDKVVLFYQAQKAVVYRPSTKKIVKTGNFAPPAPQVFLRSGSSNANVEDITKTIIGFKQYTVLSSDTSAHPNYDKTIVVDLTGRYPNSVVTLADSLHATVANMPSGEIKPSGDILVIVGPTQQ